MVKAMSHFGKILETIGAIDSAAGKCNSQFAENSCFRYHFALGEWESHGRKGAFMSDEVLEQLRTSIEGARQVGDHETVVYLCSRVLERFPDDSSALFRRGFARLSRREFALAIEDFEKYVAVCPNEPNGQFNLGLCHLRLGHPVEGSAYFTRLLKMCPDDQEGKEYLHQCQEAMSSPGSVSRPPPSPAAQTNSVEGQAQDDGPITGRMVLVALARFLGCLALVGASIAGFIFISIPLMGKESIPGYVSGVVLFGIFLVSAFYGIQRKVEFAVMFASFFLTGLVNMKRGRSIVGFGLVLLAAYATWGVGSSLWNDYTILLRERPRNLILGGMMILLCGAMGLFMMVPDEKQS